MPDERWTEGGSLAEVQCSYAGTWAASSKFIGEPEHYQHLVVSDIQTSKPFEVWLNADKSQCDNVVVGSIKRSNVRSPFMGERRPV